MKRRHPHRSGYVLLLVLLLLTLAAAALAAACRGSLDRSVRAARATEELQHRWGTISCREALLLDAENVLQRAELAGVSAQGQARARFSLGAEQFEVVISDEQAKVNINSLYARFGKDGAERAAKALGRAHGGHLVPKLLIAVKPSRQEATPRVEAPNADNSDNAETREESGRVVCVMGSWGEVFPGVEPIDLLPRDNSPTVDLTCWGDGRLNFRRASRLSLSEICSPALSAKQIDSLIASRITSPETHLPELLAKLQLTDAVVRKLTARLTEDAWCHSLWIVSHADPKTWSQFSVRDGDETYGETYQFLW